MTDEQLKQVIEDLNTGIGNIEKSGEDQYYVITKEEAEEFRAYLEELHDWRENPFRMTIQRCAEYHSGDENNPCFGCRWLGACKNAGAGAPDSWRNNHEDDY